MKKKYLFSLTLVLMMNLNAIHSQINTIERADMHHEIPDDAYVFTPRSNMPKSPAYTYSNSIIFTTQVNIDAGGNNIVGDAGNEPSIAIDPTNPNRIVIGWRQFDTVSSNFRQAGYAYSTDAGNSWTFPGPIDPGHFRSDPVLDFDANGNFYYNSLTGNFNCDVFKIEDGGVVWDNGTYAYGGDKQWMRIDRTSGIGSGNNYSFWNSAYSDCYPGAFTRSTDFGITYENCETVAGDPHWGTLAVGPAGELYLTGTGQYTITLVKSTTAQDPNETVTWDFTSSVNLDGYLDGWSPINPQGLIGQAWVDVDVSNGSGQGNVYVLASVVRSSNNDPADVMFAKSTDGGLTFESPIKINTDSSTTNYQWFGTMSVAPNGRIDVIWLDTRDAPTNSTHDSALYYCFSTDQGVTWSDNEQVSDYFDPHIGYPQQDKMGDYFDMKSFDDAAHVAWANTLNGGQDVYYAKITPSTIGVDEVSIISDFLSVKNYPNPFTDSTTLSLSLNRKTMLSIDIFDLVGNKVKSLLNKEMEMGDHSVTWDGTSDFGSRLTGGFYLYRIKTENNSITKKMLLVD